MLGGLGKGFKVAMSTLDGGRIGIASQALGIAQGALDVTVEYMKSRKQFDKKLSQMQALQFEVRENRRAGGAQDSGNTEYARKETANPQEAAETFAGGPAETDFDTKLPSSIADVQVKYSCHQSC